MKRITITSMPDKKKVRAQILKETANRREFNKPKPGAITEWFKTFPKVGDTVEIENAQYHIFVSGIFSHWQGKNSRLIYCLNIYKNGQVELGTGQFPFYYPTEKIIKKGK